MNVDITKPDDENSQVQTTPEPTSLGEALRYIDQSNRTPDEKPVEAGESDEHADGNAGGGSQGDPEGTDNGEPEVPAGDPAAGEQTDPADLGGPAVGIDAIDFNAQKQQLLRDVQRNAVMQIRKEYKDQGIGHYAIDELYSRDENTGRVSFMNPDDPDHPFASRSECQQWINAWNQAVDNKFRQDVNAKQQELIIAELPKVRVMDFYPTYKAMDKTTQDIFDQLIGQYEIKDANGGTIGYNVDLNAVARQAANIVKMFPKPQEQQQQQQPEPSAQQRGSTPALDMKTGNGNNQDDEDNPKTIQEAMRIYNKKNRRK